MNIKDRIILLKGGYSKKEIDAMIEEDAKSTEGADTGAEENKNVSDEFMNLLTNLTNEVKSMKSAMHQENINDTKIKEGNTIDDAYDILSSIINPVKPDAK